ncbi:hypothetical protein SDC9_106372 [bioreactor metagenome]|uniref:Teneurin-like YD-shell domain-containing protein n=1 Tax=bioreactor metagenome TaxID=1076179 RepID=A0A645B388_9ZZZZ
MNSACGNKSEIFNAAVPTYDADGNMLTYGDWSYTYNGENRLIAAEKSDYREEYGYDYMGRRIEKRTYTPAVLGMLGDFTLDHTYKYVYDGYKQIAEYLDGDLQRLYVWNPVGLDTPVWVQEGTARYAYLSDGNKNIRQLFDESGLSVAEYDYSPFGTVLSATGSYATVNPFRFSSEYLDSETGLVYYNYRYYSPTLGRWINRDPIGEEGGMNLYTMVRNNIIGLQDKFGLNIAMVYAESSAKTGHLAVFVGNSQDKYHYFSFAPNGLEYKTNDNYATLFSSVQTSRGKYPYIRYASYATSREQDCRAIKAGKDFAKNVYLMNGVVCTTLVGTVISAADIPFTIRGTPAATYDHNKNTATSYGEI